MSSWAPVQPSAKVVQHHYVNARAHEINKGQGSKLRSDTIAAFRNHPILAARFKGYSGAKKDAFCEDAYERFTAILQSRDLTINFEAAKWFSQENTRDSYKQMYAGGIGDDGVMLLKDGAKGNFADVRVAADDRVTFPTQWQNVQPPAHRGLRPGLQSGDQIQKRMLAGAKIEAFVPGQIAKAQITPATNAKGDKGYHSPNKYFNPHSKQVFSAVNYGRRPNGSSTYYGNSYLLLNPKLKVDALYYSGDTFQVASADAQVSYKTLGAIFLKSTDHMRKLLIDSCFDNMRLPNTAHASELLEAPIFQEVRFATEVAELHLEPSPPGIMLNAKRFCAKWGIKLSINLL
ncbi:MAG: hypothetical protein KGM96_02380 [Acidobacteriota bacterium]|nr:hypothetical protein [Acidobacteriota bacterium]